MYEGNKEISEDSIDFDPSTYSYEDLKKLSPSEMEEFQKKRKKWIMKQRESERDGKLEEQQKDRIKKMNEKYSNEFHEDPNLFSLKKLHPWKRMEEINKRKMNKKNE